MVYFQKMELHFSVFSNLCYCSLKLQSTTNRTDLRFSGSSYGEQSGFYYKSYITWKWVWSILPWGIFFLTNPIAHQILLNQLPDFFPSPPLHTYSERNGGWGKEKQTRIEPIINLSYLSVFEEIQSPEENFIMDHRLSKPMRGKLYTNRGTETDGSAQLFFKIPNF